MTKIALLSAVLAAGDAVAREPAQQTVIICLTTDRNPAWFRQPVVERATMIADEILAGAGVRLSWRGNLDPCLGESVKAVQVDFSWNTPPGELPGAPTRNLSEMLTCAFSATGSRNPLRQKGSRT